MKSTGWAVSMAAGALLIAAQAFGQNAGQGRAIVTLFTKHSEVSPTVSQQDVSAKVNGKEATVASWTQFKSADDGLELVILIDSGARNLGRQFEEITKFIQNVGPGAKVAIGYMQNGRAAMAGPFTSDPKQASGELHLPAGPGTNPYFSLSDLAQNWPSRDPRARREVILLTDGIDPNNRQFDPDDPYVQAAVRDSVRAELVVYTIYWRSRAEDSSVSNGGQSLMGELTDATGGNNYWSGTDNPVSFQPFFEDLQRRFANQYSLELSARLDRKPEVEILKVKIEGLGLQVTAPKQVYIVSASAR